jgi:hypothetical protein
MTIQYGVGNQIMAWDRSTNVAVLNKLMKCKTYPQARSISDENENNTANEWASCLHILVNNAPKHFEGLLMSSRLQNELFSITNRSQLK